jgi:hypothetical protein
MIIAVSAMILMVFVYTGLVFLWDVTSQENEPEGIWDAIVRTPYEDFFARRKNGICPTEGLVESDYKNPAENFLQFDCFF